MPKRTRLARRLSWLVVAALTTTALFGLAAVSNAASVTPTHPTGNPTCADLGYSLSFKIDTGDLENTTYAEGDAVVATNWDGQEITISGLSANGQTFDWSSTLPVSAVLVKAGNDNNNLYTYNPPVTSDTDLTRGDGQQGISHLLFCGNPPTPPPSSAPPSSAPPSSFSPPPGGLFSVPAFSIVCGGSITVTNFEFANVDDVLITPGGLVITADGTFPLAPGDYIAVGRVAGEVVTDEVPFTIEECPSEAPASQAPSPSGEVLAATGVPGGTLPPTATIDEGSTVAGDALRIVLLAMAGILTAALLLLPASAVVRGKGRR
jgi:hypothetical protein